MGTIDTSSMTPNVRKAFMEAGPAILGWDTQAHKFLDDAVINNKWVNEDISPRIVAGEKFAAFVIAFVLDLGPAWVIYELCVHWSTSSITAITFFLMIIIIVTAGIFWHRLRKIAGMRSRGAEWRTDINRLIAMAKVLSPEERQELYAAMFAAGLDVRQARFNGQAAYKNGYRDGFIIGGD